MHGYENTSSVASKRAAWNKARLIGAKPPLQPKHVWSIRTKLHIEGRVRDLAMFNLAIDSKLRGCDVVALKVDDIAPNGHAAERAIVRQKKTRQPVRFELTEQTRQAEVPLPRPTADRSLLGIGTASGVSADAPRPYSRQAGPPAAKAQEQASPPQQPSFATESAMKQIQPRRCASVRS